MVPAATPREVIARLNTEVNRIIDVPEMRSRFAEHGAIASPATPEDFGAWIKAEIAKWGKVVIASGAKVD